MRSARLLVATCVLVTLIACSNSSVEGELLVSAAASLTDAFGRWSQPSRTPTLTSTSS